MRDHAGVIARGLLAAVAVLVLAWTAVLLHDWQLGHASALVLFEPRLSAEDGRHHVERLKDAELLNPDSRWELARAKFYVRLGNEAAARRTAEDVLSSEPDNVDAWGVLYTSTRKSDPRRAAEAVRQIERLNPIALR